MKEFKRYVLTNMDTGIAVENVRNWIEFSRRLQCDKKKTADEQDEKQFGIIIVLLFRCNEQGYPKTV